MQSVPGSRRGEHLGSLDKHPAPSAPLAPPAFPAGSSLQHVALEERHQGHWQKTAPPQLLGGAGGREGCLAVQLASHPPGSPCQTCSCCARWQSLPFSWIPVCSPSGVSWVGKAGQSSSFSIGSGGSCGCESGRGIGGWQTDRWLPWHLPTPLAPFTAGLGPWSRPGSPTTHSSARAGHEREHLPDFDAASEYLGRRKGRRQRWIHQACSACWAARL